MAKRKRRKTKRSTDFKRTIRFELIGLILIALSAISIANLGAVGRAFILFFRFFTGEWYMLFLLALVILGGYFIWKREIPNFFHQRLLGIYLMLAALLLLSHVTLFEKLLNNGRFEDPSVIKNTWEIYWMEVQGETSTTDLGGGIVGSILFALSYFLFDQAGTKIMAAVLIIIGFVLLTGKTFREAFGKVIFGISSFIKKQWQAFLEDMANGKQKRRERKAAIRSQMEQNENRQEEETPIPQEETIIEAQPSEPIISSFSERVYENETIVEERNNEAKLEEVNSVIENEEEHSPPMTFTEVENEDYELPPIKLLKLPTHTDQSGEYQLIHANAAKLERTFQSFGVKAKVTQVHLGPAVTKYEVHPDVGVKVSKIVSLSDDLALALAAKDIRIEAPIPGKSAIGIEVPNSEVAMVSLREVLESKQNDKPESKLMIGLGRDITGEAVLAELNKMPHLLVAGATGSGKSVCINGIIASILMRAKPHEVKLMMIDPKMVELNVYNGIPHLLAPVVTNAKKASQALQKVVSEMERRYELFSHTGTRNIEGYNDHMRRVNSQNEAQQPLLPYIVVIVDELADLMMVASSDVEDAITRLAQMARAAGIHLIIATQRPSVDVITGVIKANIPSRIAFSVSSATDSRTILDMGGAEKLLDFFH